MKRITLVFIVCLLTIVASAQTVKKYSGQMSMPKWLVDLIEHSSEGYNGYYSYYEDKDGNRINHGSFQVNYKRSVLDGNRQYEIIGSYIHGKRNGKWTMRAKLPNGQYSRRYYYQFSYLNGFLNGPFQIYAPQSEAVEISGQFVNGLLAGKVIIKKHDFLNIGYVQIDGRVNSNGNPCGVWTERQVYEKLVPKEITRLYYDGNLVYKREKDLSSGAIEYTYQISKKINNPTDSVLIADTIINGKHYVNVAGMICYSNPEIDSDLFNLVCASRIVYFYPAIIKWRTSFDAEYYPNQLKIEKEEQRRIMEEKLKEERRKKEAEERRLWEEEQRKKKEGEAKLKAEIESAWAVNYEYYRFCWGRFESKSQFNKLYREIGLDSINAMLDSIGRYEYNNYTVEELFRHNVDNQYCVFNIFLSDIGNKKKKKLNKIFKSYDAYIECKKQGVDSMQRRIK